MISFFAFIFHDFFLLLDLIKRLTCNNCYITYSVVY